MNRQQAFLKLVQALNLGGSDIKPPAGKTRTASSCRAKPSCIIGLAHLWWPTREIASTRNLLTRKFTASTRTTLKSLPEPDFQTGLKVRKTRMGEGCAEMSYSPT